jgi:AcrR family transcriptional regulator
MARTAGFELDADQVIGAALRVVATQSVGALSMRKLADEIGVTPRAIYHYFENKELLLDGIAESLYGRIEIPLEGSWSDRLRTMLTSIRSVFVDYPGAVPYLLSRGAVAPSGIRIINAAFGWLLDAGFDEQKIADTAVLAGVILAGEAQIEALAQAPGSFTNAGSATTSEVAIEDLGHILRIAPYLARPVGVVDFEHAVDLLVNDLKRYRAASRREAGPAPRAKKLA